MTAKEKTNIILKFMELKCSYLPQEVRDIYFTKHDAAAIRKWYAADIHRVYNQILENFYDLTNIDDTDICPFCIRYQMYCSICAYGEKHGKCQKGNDTYANTLEILDDDSIYEYLIRTDPKYNFFKDAMKLFGIDYFDLYSEEQNEE